MFVLYWQMLLPIFGRSYCHIVVADVITTSYCSLPILQGGRCYCLCICGRWKNHNCLIMILADVIAMVADGMATQGGLCLADVNAMVADGIATGQLYFRFSSEMFSRTSSQMCGRWNLITSTTPSWQQHLPQSI